MTLSVAVINGKGGCGKTMVATHIVSAMANSGLRPLLVDLDRYRGATRWHKLRPKSAAAVDLTDWKTRFGKVPSDVQRVVIDCPGSLRRPEVRDIVSESDVLVVPILPSVFDEQATKLFLRRLAKLKKVRKGKKRILVVVNRLRGRSEIPGDLKAFLEELGHQATAGITDRAAYSRLAARGLTVFDSNARASQALQEEWMPLIEAIEA